MSLVQDINSSVEFNGAIKKKCLVVVDFCAEWCGPCRNIAPFFDELSVKYDPDVYFIRVDEKNNRVGSSYSRSIYLLLSLNSLN